MTAAANTTFTQGQSIVVADSPALNLGISQLQAVTLVDSSALNLSVSQLQGLVVIDVSNLVSKVSQAQVIVVYQGRIDQPSLYAWTFTLDGHDFYALRLGDDVTMVYDQNTQEWAEWGEDIIENDGTLNTEDGRWTVSCGLNWQGIGALAYQAGTDIVVGDDTFGAIYVFDPTLDEDYKTSTGDFSSFHRIAQGQLLLAGRNSVPVWGVQLSGSVGEQWTGSLVNVELQSSDDMGNTYFSHGITQVNEGDYNVRLDWNSLGIMTNPGRIFKVIDDGALVRIDALDTYDKDQN